MKAPLLSNTNGVTKAGSNDYYPARPITEIITNGFFTVDRKWTVKYWNKEAAKLLKIEAKDIVGKNLWDKLVGIIPLNFYEVYHKAFLQKTPIHFTEYWAEMGSWFDVIVFYYDDLLSVSFKGNPLKPELPEHPEQSGRYLNELYRYITEVTNDCLWEWNLKDGEIFWIDGGHKRVFGYPVENALIPQSFWEGCIHPDDKGRVLKKLNQTIKAASADIWEDEYRFKKTNGDYAYVLDRGHIVYDDKKHITRMVGATRDMTAKKLAEILLLESERKLSLIARQMDSSIIITDAEGKITWVNNAFTKMTEYTPDEVIGRKPENFLQGKGTDPSIAEYVRQKVKARQTFDCEILNYSKSGREYWMHVQGQPLLDDKGNFEHYFTLQTDITQNILLETKLIEERLTRQKEITDAVLIAQENERANIGKELHDNVNQILGATKLYIEMAKTDDENREMCLEKSSDHILEVIEEIRKISKNMASPGLHELGLYDCIRILLDDLHNVHPMKVEFHENGIDEDDMNENIQLNIFRIVQEQLNNILKHAAATEANIDLRRHGKKIILLIADNGKGCDISQKRNGIGISNIIGRAELCHGKAEIESKPGRGFQLKVVFPFTPHESGMENYPFDKM